MEGKARIAVGWLTVSGTGEKVTVLAIDGIVQGGLVIQIELVSGDTITMVDGVSSWQERQVEDAIVLRDMILLAAERGSVSELAM